MGLAQQVAGALARARIAILTVAPHPIAAYRGWVGGIVAVDGAHASRLAHPAEAAYCLLTLFLQLVPYSLAGGAGVHLGVAFLRSRPFEQEDGWRGFSNVALRHLLTIYLLVVPLFLVASLWEFLARYIVAGLDQRYGWHGAFTAMTAPKRASACCARKAWMHASPSSPTHCSRWRHTRSGSAVA